MKISKKDIEAVLSRAIVVARKGAIKEGPMVVIGICSGKMSVRSAFPQQAGVSMAGIKIDKSDDAEFIVDGDRLLGVLKKIPTGDFDMKVGMSDIVIKSGRLRYKIPKVTGVEALDVRKPGKKTFRIMCDDFDKKLKLMIPSTDNSNMFGPYEGVYMKGEGSSISMAASDRKNIVRSKMEIMDSDGKGFVAIVPKDLADFIQIFDNEKFLDVEVDGNVMAVGQEGTYVWLSLLSGNFINLTEENIRTNIKKNGDKSLTKFEAPRQELLDILSRMEVVADRENPRLKLSLGSNTLEISCTSKSGSCDDGCSVLNKEKRVMFMNLYYLRRVLRPLTSDKVELEFFAESSILFVKAAKEDFGAFCAGMAPDPKVEPTPASKKEA